MNFNELWDEFQDQADLCEKGEIISDEIASAIENFVTLAEKVGKKQEEILEAGLHIFGYYSYIAEAICSFFKD